MPTPLLTTKLYIPPVRPDPSTGLTATSTRGGRTSLVSCPRLVERLNAGLHRKFTLISAPAGFGKTTLLSEWASQRISEWAARRLALVGHTGDGHGLRRRNDI